MCACLVSGSFPNLITVSERQERETKRGRERWREVGKVGKEAGGRSPGKLQVNSKILLSCHLTVKAFSADSSTVAPSLLIFIF